MTNHMQRLIRARQAKGWSQQDLAVAAGTTVGHVSRIERGLVSPSVTLAARISWALGRTLDDLFRYEGAQS